MLGPPGPGLELCVGLERKALITDREGNFDQVSARGCDMMSCFRLSEPLIKEIKLVIANFWWSSPTDRKIHWVAWQKLCETKRDGELGFRDLRSFNMAMLVKQGWRIISNPSTLLICTLKACYFLDIFEVKIRNNPSFMWQSIYAAMDVLKTGCQ